jgi:hypothetical protein
MLERMDEKGGAVYRRELSGVLKTVGLLMPPVVERDMIEFSADW